MQVFRVKQADIYGKLARREVTSKEFELLDGMFASTNEKTVDEQQTSHFEYKHDYVFGSRLANLLDRWSVRDVLRASVLTTVMAGGCIGAEYVKDADFEGWIVRIKEFDVGSMSD